MTAQAFLNADQTWNERVGPFKVGCLNEMQLAVEPAVWNSGAPYGNEMVDDAEDKLLACQ